MKRFFTWLVLVVVVLNPALLAAAESATEQHTLPVISQEQAIKLAEAAIKKGWDYTIDPQHLPDIEYNTHRSQLLNDSYDLFWSYDENELITAILATVDVETGLVRSVHFKQSNFSTDLDNSEIFKTLSDTEAKGIATSFVKRVFANKQEELELVASNIYSVFTGNISHEYVFYRKVNGAYVNNNYLAVSVDSDTKDVSGFYCRWNDFDFHSPNGIISSNQALRTVKDKLSLGLTYQFFNEISAHIEDMYLIAYDAFPANCYALDAFSGDLIDLYGKNIDPTNVIDLSPEQRTAVEASVMDLKDLTDPISKDRARELVEKYIEDIYGTGYTIASLSLIEESGIITGIPFIWHAVFEKTEQEEITAAGQIKLNALTERLLLATNNSTTPIEEESELSFEQGYGKAIEIIKNYYADKINELETSIAKGSGNYDYIFTRKINDAHYPYNGIAVSLNPNKTIKQINYTWEKARSFDAPKVINEAIAKKNYYVDYNPELHYVMINTAKDSQNPVYELKLVYSLPANYYDGNVIDAVSGQLVDLDGVPVKSQPEFEAEHLVTKYEFLNALLEDSGNYHDLNFFLELDYQEPTEIKFTDLTETNPHYNLVQKALMIGIIENTATEFNGDEYITREEMAEILVKRLGYSEVAELQNIYRVLVADQQQITTEKYGYVALAYGYGILQAENTRLRPQEYVTKLDLYTALNNLYRVLDKE